jgi:cell division protein ZapE
MSLTPNQRYQQDLDANLIDPDKAQRFMVSHLQRLFDECLEFGVCSNVNNNPVARFLRHFQKSKAAPKGLYMWGGVGRGKTYLMDLLYECVPAEMKTRTHFHRFMQQVHRELNQLQGQENPLPLVARRIAGETRLLCFDEFFVSDIGDAMILGGLLEEFFNLGMILVTTSNISPDSLYENGLQRDRFMPVIEHIKHNMQVVRLEDGPDHRLRRLRKAMLYHYPLGDDTEAQLRSSLMTLAPDRAEAVEADVIDILGRQLTTRFTADDVVWFDFDNLCNSPRSAFDYVEISKIYHAVLLGNMPQLDSSREDQARRVVYLVDELYSRNVKLILAAEVALEDLYCGTKVVFEFERTKSRLLEMQSHEYLGLEHRT